MMFVYMHAGGHATLSMTCVFCRRTTFVTSQSLASTLRPPSSVLDYSLLHVLPARCSRASMTYVRERRARGSWVRVGAAAPRRPSQRARVVQCSIVWTHARRPRPFRPARGPRARSQSMIHARIAISDHTRRMLRYVTPRARRGKSAQL